MHKHHSGKILVLTWGYKGAKMARHRHFAGSPLVHFACATRILPWHYNRNTLVLHCYYTGAALTLPWHYAGARISPIRRKMVAIAPECVNTARQMILRRRGGGKEAWKMLEPCSREHVWSKFGAPAAKVDQVWLKFGQIWPKSDRRWPDSAKLGPIWANLAQC